MEKVLEFCDEFGMEINRKKTSFFVINGEPNDQEQMVFEDLRIPYRQVIIQNYLANCVTRLILFAITKFRPPLQNSR